MSSPQKLEDDRLLPAELRGVLICASKDPDAKSTFVATDAPANHPWRGAVIKVAGNEGAAAAVEAEGRALVQVRRTGPGVLGSTVPRYVASRRSETGLSALVATAVPGRPMAVDYHLWWRTARPRRVGTDFATAGAWLREFQEVTRRSGETDRWPLHVAQALERRWAGDAGPALDLLRRLAPELPGVPVVGVHGDFWAGNILLSRGGVSGVVDWEGALGQGSPLQDPVRFALSYATYLDRHTRPGAGVVGHRGLRRQGELPGLRHLLCGSGWFPSLARQFVAGFLEDVGLPRSAWYAACVVGLAEVAASANDPTFARRHLDLLADLPGGPRCRR